MGQPLSCSTFYKSLKKMDYHLNFMDEETGLQRQCTTGLLIRPLTEDWW